MAKEKAVRKEMYRVIGCSPDSDQPGNIEADVVVKASSVVDAVAEAQNHRPRLKKLKDVQVFKREVKWTRQSYTPPQVK